jgi:hypothetical protein
MKCDLKTDILEFAGSFIGGKAKECRNQSHYATFIIDII